jgi:tetratricopeptide (TPR) repeat protein
MRRIAVATLISATIVGRPAAWAEDKKPGLFDFQRWKTPVDEQREAAQQLAPAALDLLPAPNIATEPKVVRLRFYADGGYRNVVVRWQGKMRVQVERLNRVVEPIFNVRFEIESLRDWKRPRTDTTLDAAGAELETTDAARDVDWVVGLVTPFRGVATNVHQIGNARYLSKHLILRGMDDEQEGRLLDQELRLLSPDERQRIYGDRKVHKELVIFLHEWAHTMGVVHSESATVIMNPAYDCKQARFSDADKEVMALVLDRRVSNPGDPAPETADLLRLLESRRTPGVKDKDGEPVLAVLRSRAQPGARTAVTATPELPAAFVDRFNQAVNEANAGHRQEAWRLLAPLLADAEKSLGDKSKTAPDGQHWVRLARLANNVGAFSAAESALAHAGRSESGASDVTADVYANRCRLALPAGRTDPPVTPEKEPAFAADFEETAKMIAANDQKAARARVAVLAAAYPDAAGVDILACELDLRSKQLAAADRHCQAALAKFDDATRAHLLAGVIAVRTNRGAAAEKHFRRVISLDPNDPDAWRELSHYYQATHATMRSSQLAAEYQALFSRPLP